jgi:hypothetical protein
MRLRTICGLYAVAGVVACGGTGATGASGATTGGASATGSTGTTSASGSTASGSAGTGAGGAGSASTSGSSGGSTTASSGGGTGGSAALCKRGIAANTAPGAAFSPAVAWWYDWALQGSGAGAGIEFVPMVWGSASLGKAIPAGSAFLLGFNEPNFQAQSNLTPQQAAADWPMVEAQASATGALIASPAMNFCGPASQCNGTDPYQYLKDFFTACPGCKVDYVAVHWYNCDLPSLQDYLEPGGSLEGFEQFGKPIWLTEFSCGGSSTEAEQEAYMKVAVPYLEGNPHVFRYSWFSADPIPNAQLINADGSPTALGQVYIGLPQSCP